MATTAVLLAGGKGTRLQRSGRSSPKPLLHLADEPIINHLVEKLLKLEEVSRIEVLATKHQVLPPTRFDKDPVHLDLETAFDRWRKTWYGEEARVAPPRYEEDLDELDLLRAPFSEQIDGAVAGLFRYYKALCKETPPERLLVAAADNFLPGDPLVGFIDMCRDGVSVNAYKDLRDPELVREKFGCLEVRTDAHDNEWIKEYAEKPAEPNDTRASVALYCFPRDHLDLLEEYVKEVRAGFPGRVQEVCNDLQNGKFLDGGNAQAISLAAEAWLGGDSCALTSALSQLDSQQGEDECEVQIVHGPLLRAKSPAELAKKAVHWALVHLLGAPGHFLQWLSKRMMSTRIGEEYEAGVRAYRLSGRWFDIGNPTDLKIAVFWHSHGAELCTVDDLTVARETNRIDDKSYLVVRKMTVDADQRVLQLFFSAEEKLCCYTKDSRNLATVDQLAHPKGEEKRRVQDAWKGIRDAVASRGRCQVDGVPMLVSGGVLLFDSVPPGKGGKIPAHRALIPFLEKDLASRLDRRRLTTPAGRVDSLDIRQVCLDEMIEEFVFYGTRESGPNPTLFLPTTTPNDFADEAAKLLTLVRRHGIVIPGLDQAKLARNGTAHIEPVQLHIVERAPWTVETYLRREDKYDLMYRRTGFMFIPDEPNNTLELRLVCVANLSRTDRTPEGNPATGQVAHLSGIADGDGFHRQPFLCRAEDLIRYMDELRSAKPSDMIDIIHKSQRSSVRVLAIGDAQFGRFTQFDTRMPALFFTTAVHEFVKTLPDLVG